MQFNKNYIHFFLFAIFLLVLNSCKKSTISPTSNNTEDFSFIKAADISFIPEIRASGYITKNAKGLNEDMLMTLRNSGVNTFRLRIWVSPNSSNSGFTEVKQFSKEIKNTGAKVWLTIHYSDTWADPGNQSKPKNWENLSFQFLRDSVYQYTKKIIKEIQPDYIQIGNEINNGFLWPEGSYSQLTNFKILLREGIRAVRENSSSTKIILHYAGHQYAKDFFTSINDLDYDIIGISYYPKWHGKSLDSLNTSILDLGLNLNKKVLIAETSYPFSLGWNDWTNNIIGSENDIISKYPATEIGQKLFLNDMKSLIRNNPYGIGFCYWGGEWISFKGSTANNGSSWENQALWDFTGKALPVLNIFSE